MRRLWMGIGIVVAGILLIRPPALRASGPPSIAYGAAVDGTLLTAQSEMWYSFNAGQGDAIAATVLTTDAGFMPLVVLVDANQQAVLAVGSGIPGGSRLRYVIPTAALYILKVTASSGTGRYRLTLTLDNPTSTPSPFTNTPLIAPLESSAQADLSDAVRFRLFSIRARSGDRLEVTLVLTNGMQAGIYLYSADFIELGRAELGAPLTATFSADGVYYLMVARAVAETHSGLFTLQRSEAAAPTMIPLGGTVSGAIDTANAVRTYTLTGAAGQVVLVRMRRTSGDLVPYVYLVSTDSGQKLAEAIASGGVAELTYAVPATGNFAILATRDGLQNGTSAGAFTLTVEPPGQAEPIPPTFQGYLPIKYGDSTTGELDNTTFAVPYYFVADAGDTVVVTLTGEKTLDPYLVLQDANGNAIAENDGSVNRTAQITFKVKLGGYYAVVATRAKFDKGTSQGKYALELSTQATSATAPAPTDSSGLVPGQAVTGSIGPKVGAAFHFTVSGISNVDIDVAPTGGLEVTTILLDENLAQIAASSSGPLRGARLPHAGTYTVLVLRRGGPNEPVNGTFTVLLQGVTAVPPPSASPIPSPSAIASVSPAGPATVSPTKPGAIKIIQITYNGIATAAITADSTLNYFSFEGRAGDVITLKMSPVNGSQLQCVMYLYVYENNQPKLIDAELGSPDAVLTGFKLPATGSYLVVASRVGLASGTSTGGYTLTLIKQP
ncbi:MAG TPA: hypothetical protein VMT34_05535 [Aggregatilineales bacterium]|nr:hypothetical protein [Aggregatilineales bacterium]